MLVKIGSAWIDPEEIAAIREEIDSVGQVHYIMTRFKNADDDFLIEATMDEAEAALIDAGIIENPFPEEDEPPELTQEEHDAAADLYDRGFEWLARDKDGKLYAFRNKPEKEGAYWYTFENDKAERIDEGFDFVGFDEEEPWSIPHLLLGP